MAALSIDETPAPKLVPDARTPAEYARLEQLLAERARELQQHRLEVARLKALLRDATADFERALLASQALGALPAEPALGNLELTRQRDAAVLRALEAEAARAEALFRLDEAMGYVAPAVGLPAPDPLEETCARLNDAVRRLEGELAASRTECQEARELRERTASDLAAALDRAQGLEHERAAAEGTQLNASGLAELLQETRQVLDEFARAVERAARGGERRESSLDASSLASKPDPVED
jgi:hypothetical protein